MPNKSFADMQFRIDNASGTLANITSFINQVSLQSVLSMLEDLSMGDTVGQVLPGVAKASGAFNGFWNTTTDAIFGPLVGARTSITKTIELRAYASPTNRFYNGEVYVNDVEISGKTDDLELFSASYTVDGAVTRTSVAL